MGAKLQNSPLLHRDSEVRKNSNVLIFSTCTSMQYYYTILCTIVKSCAPLSELRLISRHILRVDAADSQTLVPLHHVFYVRTVVSTVVGNIVFLVVVVVDVLELRIISAETMPAPRVEQPSFIASDSSI